MYVTKWVQGAKREHGLDIDYVGQTLTAPSVLLAITKALHLEYT